MIPAMESLPRPLKLWFLSRTSGKYLSGALPITHKVRLEVREMTGLKIESDDTINFPRCLSRYGPYQGTIYRGVFETDKFLNALLLHGIATTQRYFSCTDDQRIAKRFGSKIMLVITTSQNHDVRKISRESEVILKPGTTFTIVSDQTEAEHRVITLNEK